LPDICADVAMPIIAKDGSGQKHDVELPHSIGRFRDFVSEGGLSVPAPKNRSRAGIHPALSPKAWGCCSALDQSGPPDQVRGGLPHKAGVTLMVGEMWGREQPRCT